MSEMNQVVTSDGRILKQIYWSNTLKLELQQYFKPVKGFSFIKQQKEMFIEDCNLNNIIIKLDGVNRNLTRKELKTYINVSLKSSSKMIQKEAEKFVKKFPRLLNI